MAIVAGHAVAPRGLPAPRWLAPASSLLVAAVGLGAVAIPALQTGTAARLDEGGAAPVVRLVGTVSTTGLPAAAATSRLSVRNDGTTPLAWSARSSVTGTGASGVRVEAWRPARGGCGTPTHDLAPDDWSPALQPGQSVPLCVRVSVPGPTAGAARPVVSVVARAA